MFNGTHIALENFITEYLLSVNPCAHEYIFFEFKGDRECEHITTLYGNIVLDGCTIISEKVYQYYGDDEEVEYLVKKFVDKHRSTIRDLSIIKIISNGL